MNTKFISALAVLFLTGFGLIHAQTTKTQPQKENVIHIKMIKNINGVETIVDTTISADGLALPELPNISLTENMDSIMHNIHIEMADLEQHLKNMDHDLKNLEDLKDLRALKMDILMDTSFTHGLKGMVQLEGLQELKGLEMLNELKFEISIDSNFMSDHDAMMLQHINMENLTNMRDTNVRIMILSEDDAEYQKLMEELAKEDGNIKREKRVMIIQEDCKGKENKGEKIVMEMQVIYQTCNIEDLSKEDRKRLKNEEKSFNEKLKVDQVNFYPNPNNGRFNLGFTLEKQGDTEITIMDMNGKQVYSEKLPGFSGSYKKEIDISNNAAGVYYIKVTQGKDSFFKKMILQ